MIRTLLAALFGAGVGISGVFLHNAYKPIGLIASLMALLIGGYLVREMYHSRLRSWAYVAGWVFIVLRGSTVGNGGELLIEANSYGNIFVFAGFILILVFTFRSKRVI